MRKLPEESVEVDADVAPEASVSATAAPGMMAPLASVTVPVRGAGAAAADDAFSKPAGRTGAAVCAMANGQSTSAETRTVRSKTYPSRQLIWTSVGVPVI